MALFTCIKAACQSGFETLKYAVYTNIYTKLTLAIADNSFVRNRISKNAKKLGVSRFVAAENLADALGSLNKLEAEGKLYSLALLGEFVSKEEQARAMTNGIIKSLEFLKDNNKAGYMSVKPSQLGLGIDYELALENATSILNTAAKTNAHICLDMENTPYVDNTLRLFKDLRKKGFDNVSTVLQSYLRRSMADMSDLLEQNPNITLRLVKGAYKEDNENAYQRKAKIAENLLEMIYKGLEAGAKINIATHDAKIIKETSVFIRGAKLSKERYEYQMLFGVSPKQQAKIVKDNHPLRIYVPYGQDWYGYFSRRLAERPANLAFVLKGLFN